MAAPNPKPPFAIHIEVMDPCTFHGLRSSTIVLVYLILVGCNPDPNSEQIVVEGRLPPGYSADRLPSLEAFLADKDLRSGQWHDENGTKVCDGYVTRFADQDYCASEVPEDWVPFEFNGQQFYLQPLARPEER